MVLGIRYHLMPQVLGVVGQLLFVLAFTNKNFLHVAGKCLAHLRRHLLVTAGHAPLAEWHVAATWATPDLKLFVLANRLVQLVARVKRIQTVEVNFVEVVKETNDVAAEVQQVAIHLPSLRRRAQATAPHLDRGRQ